MRFLLGAALIAGAMAIPAPALAQADWPVRPVRIIVPAPAAGPFDRIIRPLAQHMGGTLEEQWRNRGGVPDDAAL